MISGRLAKTYVGQAALLWLGCGATLFAFSWVRVWVVSLIDMGRFKVILDQFRDYERFAPIGFDQLFTYTGRVGMTFDEPVVIFCVVVWAISRGSDVVSGELNRGTMEMILAQPISRVRLLMTHAVVSASGLAMLTLLVWLGIWVGVQLTTVEETVPPPQIRVPFLNWSLPLATGEPDKIEIAMRDEIDCSVFIASTLNLFAFGFFILGLSTMVSAMDRYRWRTVGIVITIYILQIVMFGLGKAAERLNWLMHFTFFDLYRPQPIAKAALESGQAAAWSVTPVEPDTWLGPLALTLMLVGLGLVAYAIAIRAFDKRDLPAPL
ncbi:ABC transporter permease subunit [Planctomycetaceae bacterium SH139]